MRDRKMYHQEPPPKPVSLARVSIMDAKHKFTADDMRAGMIARGLLDRQNEWRRSGGDYSVSGAE